MRVGAADRVVVPRAGRDQRAGRADGRAAERGDALGGLVDHRPDGVDLRVEHLVHRDEVRADDVPVHVLEGQLQVVQRVEPVLQDRGDLLALGGGESGNRVLGVEVGNVSGLPSVSDLTRTHGAYVCPMALIVCPPVRPRGRCRRAAHPARRTQGSRVHRLQVHLPVRLAYAGGQARGGPQEHPSQGRHYGRHAAPHRVRRAAVPQGR